MTTQFAEAVLRYRWPIIIFSLLLVFAAAAGLRNFVFDTNYRAFFAEGNPQLAAFEAMQDTYDKSDSVTYVVTPKSGGSVFTAANLSALVWLTEESWQIPYSTRVDSLTNFQHTRASEDDLVVADLVKNPQDLSLEQLKEIEQIALNEPLLKRRLISSDGTVTGVNATIYMPEDSIKALPEIAAHVRDLRDRFLERYPEFELRITGVVMLNNAFGEAASNDMATLIPMMFALVIVVLGVLLRSFSATFATVLVIFMSICTAMGIFFWAGFKLTGPVSPAPTIILTMAVADSVHLLSSYLLLLRQGEQKFDAIVESLRINFQPILVTSVTTAIGFLSMNFSEVPPLQHLGNVVAFGVLVAFVLSVTFLPAMVYVLPIKVKAAEEKPSFLVHWLKSLSYFVIENRRLLMWFMLAFSLFFMAFLPKNQINDEFVKYFDKSIDFRNDTDYASEHLLGPYTFEYNLQTGEPNGISTPAFLNTVQRFIDYLEGFDEVSHVTSLTDTIKRLNKNLHADDPEWYRLPEARELAAQYLLLYEMSLPYGLDLNNQIDIDKSSTRVTVTVKNMTSKQSLALEEEWGNWLTANALDYQFEAASPNLMFAHIGQRNAESMVGGLLMALFGISLILIFALRSVKLGLLSLVPNLVPIGIGFGFWGMIDGMVGMALSMVSGMTLGIVVDDTVHFLSKYLRAYREKGLSAESAVHYAFEHVGPALVTTTIVLMAGFLVLSVSTFRMNADMGLLTAFTIGIALIVDFLLLPPLLIKMAGKNV